MNHIVLPALLSLTIGLGMFSCSHPREAFLKDSVEEASQEDIKNKLGPPVRIKNSLLSGETTWIYRYVMTEKELDATGIKSIGKGVSTVTNAAASLIGKGEDQALLGEKPLCFHYLLTFDKSNILKSWRREDCTQTPL